jgi:hypothetical protein
VKREGSNLYAGFKNDRDRLWALISRDLRIVAVTALCASASGASPLLRVAILRWLA